MLEGELDAHLDYYRHVLIKYENSRNGFASKKLKTSCAEKDIKASENVMRILT